MIPDPASPQGLNRYVYAHNSPIKYNDPDGHCPICATTALGALGGLIVGYGSQVVSNINSGMNLGQALTTDINLTKVAQYTVAGALAGAGVGVIGGLVSAGLGTTAATQVARLAATAVGAASADGNPTNEIETVIADTDLVMGKNILPGQAAITPMTVQELADKGRLALSKGFQQISAETQPGFAQAQAFFNRIVPDVQGKAGDVYNLATTAMTNARLLTGDRSSIFDPLAGLIRTGKIGGYVRGLEMGIDVPEIGRAIIELMRR